MDPAESVLADALPFLAGCSALGQDLLKSRN
jgi:hypothetical protein